MKLSWDAVLDFFSFFLSLLVPKAVSYYSIRRYPDTESHFAVAAAAPQDRPRPHLFHEPATTDDDDFFFFSKRISARTHTKKSSADFPVSLFPPPPPWLPANLLIITEKIQSAVGSGQNRKEKKKNDGGGRLAQNTQVTGKVDIIDRGSTTIPLWTNKK